VEFRSESQRIAIKRAFFRITSDDSWPVMKQLAEETVYALEQKSLAEDDEEKAKTYRHDARGARKFWAQWLMLIDQVKGDEETKDTFLEVAID
jgi:hypothetical protein